VNATARAPFLCVELEPRPRVDNTKCTCWARTGGRVISTGVLPRPGERTAGVLRVFCQSSRQCCTGRCGCCA
jgi:hypothetical protein